MARRRRCGVQRFIFNRSTAIGANSYLMLYPREPLTRLIGGDPARARLVWQVLKDIASEVMIAGGRVYGGGLFKLEPGELASIPAAGYHGAAAADSASVALGAAGAKNQTRESAAGALVLL